MGEGVLRLLLQPWESREVAVVFTPSDHKPTTTILIIRYLVRGCCCYQALKKSEIVELIFVFLICFSRNNLTVFDMKMVRGHGAKELLRVGGKLPGPGASLRFNVPQSTLMECRDGEIIYISVQFLSKPRLTVADCPSQAYAPISRCSLLERVLRWRTQESFL